MSVLNIALVIAMLGFQNALPREVAFYRERKFFKCYYLVNIDTMNHKTAQ